MLFLVFLLLAFALVVLLWGGTLVLQGWLYQNPPELLPIRAAVSGVVMALFFTFWCWIDQRNPGKYETILEFSSTEIIEHDEFISVRKMADGSEENVVYKKTLGSRGVSSDYKNAKGEPWARNPSQSMMVAILIKDKDRDELVRFDANLVKVNRGGQMVEEFPKELRYTEERGSRYMLDNSLGKVYRKKTGVFLANLLLNLFHFGLWWMVLWFGLRFQLWHAFGLALVMWVAMVLVGQPILFGQTRPA